ncbi:hypothetical protein AnigIFM50267_011380 [Aspergillus niger]|nr:hypothetical protein AnigIFM50267_011380 [Aspergillus niger]
MGLEDFEAPIANYRSQEPEDRLPSQRSSNATPDDWAHGDGYEQASLEDPRVATTLGPSGDISDNAKSNRDCSGATGALKKSQNNECRVTLRFSKSDTGAPNDNECAQICCPATFHTRD